MRIQFDYHNHEGKTELRDVDIVAVGFDPGYYPEYGYQPGWFVNGWDYSRGRDGTTYRSFALSKIVFHETPKQFWKLLELPKT